MCLIPSLILLCSLLSPANSQFEGSPSILVKSTTLTRSTPSQQGATVSIQSKTEVAGFIDWDIEVTRDDTWHLLLDLDNTWGFHRYKPSAITIEIDSDTIPDNSGLTTFDDIFLGFTVNSHHIHPQNNEFTAVRLVMDKDTYKNRITPGCDYIAPYNTYSLKTGDLSTILNGAHYRFCPLHLQNTMDCGGANGKMRDISGSSKIDIINEFPIRFTLENHPNDYVILKYQNTQICGFKKGFDTNQGLQIYFAIRDNGMDANITSFYIEYSYDNSPTPSPTYSPTPYPTDSPTEIPTYSPTENTRSPTKLTSNPTVPTLTPSHNPSVYPTIAPSIYPTKQPTYNPSKYPTYIPSADPTINPSVDPTENPSIYPTQNPSNYPTKTPSYIPSVDPTINPSVDPTQNPSVYPIQNVRIFVPNSFTKTPSMDRSSAQITSKPTNSPSITSNYLSSNEVGIESKSLAIEYIIFIIMGCLICFCFICLCFICLWFKKKAHKMEKIANKSHSNGIRINMSIPTIPNAPKLKDKVNSNSIYSAMSKEKEIKISDEVNRKHTNGGNEEEEEDEYDNKQNIGLSMIGLWLQTKVRLPQYYPFFAQNGYDTLDIIKEINHESELIDIGIDEQQHIQQIMKEIRKLQKLCASIPDDDQCKVTPMSDDDESECKVTPISNDNNNYIKHRRTLGMGEEDIEHVKTGEM